MSGGFSTAVLALFGMAAVGVMVYSMGFATKQLEVFAFLKPQPVVTSQPISFGKILSATHTVSPTPAPVQ